MRPAHQGFKGNDLPVADIHNGLERKTEFKADFAAGIKRHALSYVSVQIWHTALPRFDHVVTILLICSRKSPKNIRCSDRTNCFQLPHDSRLRGDAKPYCAGVCYPIFDQFACVLFEQSRTPRFSKSRSSHYFSPSSLSENSVFYRYE